MGFYDELLSSTEDARREFLDIPAVQAGGCGAISIATYQAFLSQAFHHVRHTVPLLMACGARAPERSSCSWLRPAVAEYVVEEIGHEEWILNDIRASGADPGPVRHGTPHPATELMIAYAYDTVLRRNPLGLFGMVLVLEGASADLALAAADAIQARLGLPDEAFSYLRSHGALDLDHMRFFAGLMQQVEDASDRAEIIHCARMFYRLYGDIFRALPVH